MLQTPDSWTPFSVRVLRQLAVICRRIPPRSSLKSPHIPIILISVVFAVSAVRPASAQCPNDPTCAAVLGSVLVPFGPDTTARYFAGDGANFFGSTLGIGAQIKAFGDIVFYASPDGFLTERMRITSAGNIDASGSIFASGNISTNAGNISTNADIFALRARIDDIAAFRISAVIKNFKIDHPLDPANKYLYHASVESSELKNIYDGVVALNENGEAWVTLPHWFGVLNRGTRYQLTAIGAPAPGLHIAERVTNNRFKIAGGSAGLEVSWQVTGIRNDPVSKKHEFVVEENKPIGERGYYLDPAAYNQAESKKIKFGSRSLVAASGLRK